MRQFTIAKRRRDHADDMPTGGEDGIGDQPHEPDPAAAEHQPDTSRGETAAQFAGRVAVPLVDRAGGAAIDANAPDLLHSNRNLDAHKLSFSSSDRPIIASTSTAP